uniref:Uncharacterized protein n=1 Tax=Clastoptera arizonana TaxID=38151 RepID=A0A1B6D9B6_9HEMI
MESAIIDGETLLSIKNTLLEYEKKESIIENQLKSCVEDHDKLRKYSTAIVDENKRLVKILQSKCENESENQTSINLEESILLQNLKQQLALINNEKDTVKEMWTTSAQTIEDLKCELQKTKEQMENKAIYKKMETLKRDYSDAINLLETKLFKIQEERNHLQETHVKLDVKIQYMQSEIESTSKQNQELNSKLTMALVKSEELNKKCILLESKNRQLELCKDKDTKSKELETLIEKFKTERKDLEKALEKCHSTIEILRNQALAGKDKVEEAVKLVDDALADRDSALSRALKAEDESLRLQKEIKTLIDEAGFQVNKELLALKEEHSKELIAAQLDLKIAKQDNANKCAEIQQLNKECKRLESLITENNNQVPAKLDKKLDKFYDNLLASEETKFQILSENEAIKRSHESLLERHRYCKMEKDMLAEQLLIMEEQIKILTKELKSTHERAEKLAQDIQNMHVKEHRLGNDELVLKLQQIQEKNIITTRELNRHIEQHKNMAKK